MDRYQILRKKGMEITLAGKKIKTIDGLRDYLNKAMKKTITNLSDVTSFHVDFSLEKHHHFSQNYFNKKGLHGIITINE